jgi:Ca-activated chloride channel family protein
MNAAGLVGGTWTWATAQGALEILYPWALLLLPLPLAVWRWLPAYHERVEALHVPFFAPAARITGHIPAPGSVVLRRNLADKLVMPLAWALAVLAAAGPQWVEPPIERIESGRDLLLAVDLSQSMEEKDFPDPEGQRIGRLTAVKRVLDAFVARRKGDRIGLVVFGSGAYVESTFTLDHALVRAQLDAARPGIAGPRTAIGDAIGLGVKLFDEQKTKHKVMILLTDGNDTASRMPPEKAAEIAAARGITVHTVGIGDPAARGQDKVDVPALEAIAAKTRGRFFLGSDQRALAGITTELDALEKQNFETLSYRPKHPLFQWPLGAAVLLLFALHGASGLAALVRRRRSHA